MMDHQLWQRAAGLVALMICPAALMIFGLTIMKYMSPIFSGIQYLDYDPAYQYLFNGAGLMRGYNPSHIDHPGTPVQLLTGIITVISWSIARVSGLEHLEFTESIAVNSEAYLRVIMTLFLGMNCIAIYFLGAVISRSTRVLIAGVACQSAYFLFGMLFPRIFHVAPEAILCLAATSLMIALTPIIFGNEECSDRRAGAVGFLVALGVISKVTFFPLLLLLFVIKRPRALFVALWSSILAMLALLLPILGKVGSFFGWLVSIAKHEGSYGTGTPGFVNWPAIPERLASIVFAEPLLIVAVVSLASVIIFLKPDQKRIAAIVVAAISLLIILTLKHFGVHYLMPAVAIAPATIVWVISSYTRRQLPYAVLAFVATCIGVLSLHNMSTAFAGERSRREANGEAISKVIASYRNPVVIGAYRSGYRPWAIQFALAWSDLKFARLFPVATGDDSGLFYDSNSKKLRRVHMGEIDWSFLDRFERAGRVVLVVQPRGTKIDQRTIATETLLDQGFGDTVERVIVSRN